MPTTPQGNVLSDLFINLPGYAFPFLGGPGARARQAEKVQHQLAMQEAELRQQAFEQFRANPQMSPFYQPARVTEAGIGATEAGTAATKQRTKQEFDLFPDVMAQGKANVAATTGAEARAAARHIPEVNAVEANTAALNRQPAESRANRVASVLAYLYGSPYEQNALQELFPNGPTAATPTVVAGTEGGPTPPLPPPPDQPAPSGDLAAAAEGWPQNLAIAPGGIPMNLAALMQYLGQASTKFPDFFRGRMNSGSASPAAAAGSQSAPSPARGASRDEVRAWLEQGQPAPVSPTEQFRTGGPVRGSGATPADVMQWLNQGQPPPLTAPGAPMRVPDAVQRPLIRGVGKAAQSSADALLQLQREAQGAVNAVPNVGQVRQGVNRVAEKQLPGLPARAARSAMGMPPMVQAATQTLPAELMEFLRREHPEKTAEELKRLIEQLRRVEAGRED